MTNIKVRRMKLFILRLSKNPLFLVVFTAFLTSILVPLYENYRNKQNIIVEKLGILNDLNSKTSNYIQKTYRLIKTISEIEINEEIDKKIIKSYEDAIDDEQAYLNVIFIMSNSSIDISIEKADIEKLIESIKKVNDEIQTLVDLRSMFTGEVEELISNTRSEIDQIMANQIGVIIAKMYNKLI